MPKFSNSPILVADYINDSKTLLPALRAAGNRQTCTAFSTKFHVYNEVDVHPPPCNNHFHQDGRVIICAFNFRGFGIYDKDPRRVPWADFIAFADCPSWG